MFRGSLVLGAIRGIPIRIHFTWLIIFGLFLIAAGLLWPAITKLGLGRLPGDIVIERENFRLYLPLMTSLLLSGVVNLIFWLLNR